MDTIGQRFRKIRNMLNLSQSDVASYLETSNSYISQIEKDKSSISVENLIKLLLNYNINLNYLLGDIGEPFIDTPQQDEQLKKLVAQIVDQTMKERGLI